MTDGRVPRREGPFGRDPSAGPPALRGGGGQRGEDSRPAGAARIEIRTASIRLPGIVGLLLAIPAFFLFGLIAIMLVVAGAVGMLIGPWMLRRMLRRMEAEVPAGDTTIELDRAAYSDREAEGPAGDATIELDRSAYEEQAQDRAPISRSSSSRKRGNTSV